MLHINITGKIEQTELVEKILDICLVDSYIDYIIGDHLYIGIPDHLLTDREHVYIDSMIAEFHRHGFTVGIEQE